LLRGNYETSCSEDNLTSVAPEHNCTEARPVLVTVTDPRLKPQMTLSCAGIMSQHFLADTFRTCPLDDDDHDDGDLIHEVKSVVLGSASSSSESGTWKMQVTRKAPCLRPAPSPFLLESIPVLELPELASAGDSIQQLRLGDLWLDEAYAPRSIYAPGIIDLQPLSWESEELCKMPRAPCLRPAASPISLEAIPDLELPEASEANDSAHEDNVPALRPGGADELSRATASFRDVHVLKDLVWDPHEVSRAPSLAGFAPSPVLLASMTDLELPEASTVEVSLQTVQLPSMWLDGADTVDNISDMSEDEILPDQVTLAITPRMPSDASTCVDFEDLQEVHEGLCSAMGSKGLSSIDERMPYTAHLC